MKTTLLPKNTCALRLERLRKSLHLDAYLIENPLDLFYFTDLLLSSGKLIIHATHSLLLVDGRYLEMAKKQSLYPVALEKKDSFFKFCQEHQIQEVGFDGEHTCYDRFVHLKKDLNLISSTSTFKKFRTLKDQEELIKMKKSADLLWKGFTFLSQNLKEGISEKELSNQFKIHCLQLGADGFAFEPIIAFGPGSAMPHHRSGSALLKKGDVVLIDIGVVLDGYHSDMTRVLFFGQKDPELARLYEIVKRAQSKALEMCKVGNSIWQIDLAAREVFRQEGVEELFVHSLGHGIGLETHEYPRLKFDGEDKDVILEGGMVFTVEPGLYIPSKGGVRYEDTIVMTKSGYENFYP